MDFSSLHPSLLWQTEHSRNPSSGGQGTPWFHTTRDTQGTASLCIHTQLPLPERAHAISSPKEKPISTECKDYSLLGWTSSEHIMRFFLRKNTGEDIPTSSGNETATCPSTHSPFLSPSPKMTVLPKKRDHKYLISFKSMVHTSTFIPSRENVHLID